MILDAAFLVAPDQLEHFQQTLTSIVERHSRERPAIRLHGAVAAVSFRQRGRSWRMTTTLIDTEQLVLGDLLNHVLDKGVVISGTVTISVADIDLLVLDLRLLLTSIETSMRRRERHDNPARLAPDRR